jgi:hypothetical protein
MHAKLTANDYEFPESKNYVTILLYFNLHNTYLLPIRRTFRKRVIHVQKRLCDSFSLNLQEWVDL